VPRPAGKQPLDAAVGERALDREWLGQLYLDVVGRCHMEAAVYRLLAFSPGVKERKHLPPRVHRPAQVRNHRRQKCIRQVVKRCPKEHHVEGSSGKAQRLIQKPFGIQDGLAVFILADLPVVRASIVNQVREEDTVPHVGEEIDVGRRCKAHIDNAQPGFGQQPLADRRPAVRVARHLGPGWAGRGNDRHPARLFFKPTPQSNPSCGRRLECFQVRLAAALLEDFACRRRNGHFARLHRALGQIHFAAKDGVVFDSEPKCAYIPFH